MAEKRGFRDFLQTPAGKALVAVLLIGGLALVVYQIWSSLAPDATVAFANAPLFIDAETGQTFHVTLTDGMTIPVKNPSTGKLSGYKAELCFWTKDGKPKTEPTAVLMIDDLPGRSGPTFCKDCGRLVVHHNPGASATRPPPPTEAEFTAQNN